MTIPSRGSAASVLLCLEPPPWFLRHACAVADVAAWLAVHTRAAGVRVDPTLAAVAGLLHDVDKLPLAGTADRHRHGVGSAAWLAAKGMAELAPVVRDHPVTRLAEPGWDAWLADAPVEARIVAYADKRAGQRLEPMAARFASWRRRYPSTGVGWDDDTAALVASRAQALEQRVCADAAVGPTDVRRLRWAARALREATA